MLLARTPSWKIDRFTTAKSSPRVRKCALPKRSCTASVVDWLHHRVRVVDGSFPRDFMAAHPRRRYLGHQHSGRLGICDCEFRLVDWDRARRHVHLRDFAVDVSTLAHRHQSLLRSDDIIRDRMRGNVPVAPSRAALGFLLAVSISGYDENVAAVSQPAGVGRVCSWHIFYSVAVVLVSRAGA